MDSNQLIKNRILEILKDVYSKIQPLYRPDNATLNNNFIILYKNYTFIYIHVGTKGFISNDGDITFTYYIFMSRGVQCDISEYDFLYDPTTVKMNIYKYINPF
jgi:hypothetical protein